MGDAVTGSGGTFVVALHENGMRVDRVVAGRLGVARARAAELCARGLVRVKGRRVAKGTVVVEGDEVVVNAADAVAVDFAPRPNPAIEVRVLLVDNALIAVDKAAGIATHPLRADEDDTLANGLVVAFPELSALQPAREAGIAHRLDRGTSGVVVVGRTAEAYAALRESFACHSVEKEYLALVVGKLVDGGVISQPIRNRGPAAIERGTRRGVGRGLDAQTRFEPVEVYESGLTLVRVETRTGRRHQVRVHLASIGHPLAGDAAYQNENERRADVTLLKWPFLHASRIVVPHPVTGARVEVVAELPGALCRVLDDL